MNTSQWILILVGVYWSAQAISQEALPGPEVAQLSQETVSKEAALLVRTASYGHRTEEKNSRSLDPVVFTEISPFTADESAVKLPPDQELTD